MKKKVSFIFIVALALFLCLPVRGQDSSKWKAIGPYGGSIIALAVNPQNQNECFAIGNTSRGYIYWSKNRGGTWRSLYNFPSRVYDIGVDPIDPNHLFVLSIDSLFTSIDKGKSWSKKPFGYNVDTQNGKIILNTTDPDKLTVIGKDNTDSKKLYILNSMDGAESWTRQVIFTAPTSIRGTNIVISPSSPNVIYAMAYFAERSSIYYKSRLFKSTDGGKTWGMLPEEVGRAVNTMAIDPFVPEKIYVGTNWEVLRSSDGGQTWQDSEDYVYSRSLAIDPANPDILYSGYENCCYKSEDGGVHWEKYHCGELGSCRDLLTLTSNVLYASDIGIFASQDGGKNWEDSHTGISKVCIKTVSVTDSFPIKIFALPNDGEILYVSEDLGISWDCSEGLESCGRLNWIEARPDDPEMVFITTIGGG